MVDGILQVGQVVQRDVVEYKQEQNHVLIQPQNLVVKNVKGLLLRVKNVIRVLADMLSINQELMCGIILQRYKYTQKMTHLKI